MNTPAPQLEAVRPLITRKLILGRSHMPRLPRNRHAKCLMSITGGTMAYSALYAIVFLLTQNWDRAAHNFYVMWAEAWGVAALVLLVTAFLSGDDELYPGLFLFALFGGIGCIGTLIDMPFLYRDLDYMDGLSGITLVVLGNVSAYYLKLERFIR